MAESLYSGSCSSPPTPNQAHVESITSSLIESDQNSNMNPPPQSTTIGKVLNTILLKIRKRFKRRAKYPAPFDRFFEQLDLWKLVAVLGVMVTAMVTFHSYMLISKECMQILLAMLGYSMLFSVVAFTLQNCVPEIAVTAMLAGFALVIAAFHTVVLHLVDPLEKIRHLVISVLLIAYGILLIITLHKIVKEDVREEEEQIEEDSTPMVVVIEEDSTQMAVV